MGTDVAFAEAAEIANAAVAKVELPDLSAVDLAKLAREVAFNIKDLDVILGFYKLTQEQYDYLCEHHQFFKRALDVAILEWNSSLSTAERVKLESAAILEDLLPRIGARVGNQAEGLPGVVEGAKLLAKLAGLGEKEAVSSAPGEKFSITINLGADEKLVYRSREETPAVAGSTSAIPINTEARSSTGAISEDT